MIYWPETVRCWRTKVPQLSTVALRNNPIGETLFYLGRKLHLPAHAYLLGLNHVADHNAGGHSSYLLGMRSDTGWWYYFPVVFAVKSTDGGAGGDPPVARRRPLAGVEERMDFADGARPRPAAAVLFCRQHDQRHQHRYAAHPAGLPVSLRGRRGLARHAGELAPRHLRHGGSGDAADRGVRADYAGLSGVLQRTGGRSRAADPNTWWIPISTGDRTSRNSASGWTPTTAESGARASITSATRRCAITGSTSWVTRGLSTRRAGTKSTNTVWPT